MMGLDLSLFSDKELLSLRRKYVLTVETTKTTNEEFYLAIAGARGIGDEISRRNRGRNEAIMIRSDQNGS